MRIEQLWPLLEEARQKSEEQPSTSLPGGWALRLIRPDPSCPLYVGIELSSGRRGLLLRVAGKLIPTKSNNRISNSLAIATVPINSDEVLFGVLLRDIRNSDTFSALAEDLARRITKATTPTTRISSLLEGIKRWQKFLVAGNDGLSEEAQSGLWGELHFLGEQLIPKFGCLEAVSAWQGSKAAHQDFVMPGGAIEVKTTTAKKPHVLRISSERQLDEKGLPSLFLHHVALSVQQGAGETLPDIISRLRGKIAAERYATEIFEEGLLAVGYLDLHIPRYAEKGYMVREINDFAVRRGFPRITERDLPKGIGNVTYLLSVEACRPFSITTKSLLNAVAVR